MLDISSWTDNFVHAVQHTFPGRVQFVGLQGSYGRGEATENSDIDMVVILDHLAARDVQKYNEMLDSLPNRELICGFLCGKEEFLRWEPFDLFQLYYDTTPLLGNLDEVRPLLDEAAVRRAIRVGACNTYHGCLHNMLYGKSENALRGLYKSAVFAVQAIAFLQTGHFIRRQSDLPEALSAEDRAMVETALALKTGAPVAFWPMSEALLTWAQRWIV